MKPLECFLVLTWALFFVEGSLGLCDFEILEPISCGEGVRDKHFAALCIFFTTGPKYGRFNLECMTLHVNKYAGAV